ncbi:hypothetical protein [Streptomyces sp. NPDC047968]|uniref:hypothetical protein n=1 Tax=unclassified Streptomyces TaxID=2593676 RepID=UPI00343CA863
MILHRDPTRDNVPRRPAGHRPVGPRSRPVLRGIGERDPKEAATVCGGSPAYARALGFAWPERPSP